MKKKIIGILVAALGSTAVMASAAALYVKAPQAKDVGIGAHTTSDIALQIANFADDEKAVNPSQDRSMTADLNFTTASGSQYSQDVYLTKLTVKVTADTHDLAAALFADSTCALSGYNDPQDGNGENWWKNNNIKKDDSLAEDAKEFKWEGFAPIYKATDTKKISMALKISVKNTADADFVAFNAAKYSVKIDLNTVSSSEYDFAYVCGVNGWDYQDVYQMVPNPQATKYEWMYKTSATAGDVNYIAHETEFKLMKGAEGSRSMTPGNGEPNAKWNSENSGKAMYWSGTENDTIYFG